MEATVMDRYDHIEVNVVAAAKMGRWAGRVTYEPPTSDRGSITVADAATGQAVQVIADNDGLWLRSGSGPRFGPVRQGAVVRAFRRAVGLWRSGGRVPDSAGVLAGLAS